MPTPRQDSEPVVSEPVDHEPVVQSDASRTPSIDSVPEAPKTPTRRRFLQTLGATAALPWVAAWPAAAQTAPTPAPAPAPTTPPAPDPDAAAAQADSRSLLEMLQRRYGAKWTPEQVEALRSDLEDGVSGGRVLRKLELQNADEPAVIFVARVPEV